MSKIYVVKSNDTLAKISRIEYGDASKYMTIFSANPQLKSGDANVIYEGEILYIPDDPNKALEDELKQLTINTDEIDEISVFIDGTSIPLPDGYDIEIFYDTISDLYKMSFPYTYDNPDIVKLFKPYGLQEIKIFMGKELLLTGVQEGITNGLSPNSIKVDSSGRSKTYLLIKSNIPNSAYPLERENLKLDQIMNEWLLPLFGYKLIISTDPGPLFERVALEPTDSIWQFLSNLAVQRKVVLSNTNEGKLEIKIPDLSNIVASFEAGKTAGIESLQLSFDSSKRFGNWIGNAQTPGDNQLSSEFQDTTFNEQSYKVLTLSDVTAGNINQALQYEATKSIRDSLTFPLTFPGWINPQTNQIWKAGEIINIKAPQIQLNNGFDFLIRSILYKKTPTRKIARMKLIPPQSYTGELIKKFPWD